MFKFQPLQYVHIKSLDCTGRVNRCIFDGGLQTIYQVYFTMNGECKSNEFYEDEIEPE